MGKGIGKEEMDKLLEAFDRSLDDYMEEWTASLREAMMRGLDLSSREGRPALPASWRPVVGEEVRQPYYAELTAFLEAERRHHTVFPPEERVFSALELTAYEEVRVLLLGQDPYPGEGQAHGLAFSVLPGVRPPQSLVNIFKELHDDLGCRVPNNGYLAPWAKQGVLLLNTVLTVRAHAPNSHKGKGWEKFTDAVIRKVGAKSDSVVFLLWGGHAQKKIKLIDTDRHVILQSAHPSPLSARNGFFGSRPFSQTNDALRAAGRRPIDWQIPDLGPETGGATKVKGRRARKA
jgi:uracil-DNA glycosylase